MNKKEVFNAIQNGAMGRLKNRTDMATVVKSNSDSLAVDLYLDGQFQKTYTEREFMKASMFAAKGIVLENPEPETKNLDSKKETATQNPTANINTEQKSETVQAENLKVKDEKLKTSKIETLEETETLKPETPKTEISKTETPKEKSAKSEIEKQKDISTPKVKLLDVENPKLNWKIENEKLCISGNYEEFYNKKTGFDKRCPVKLLGQWQSIKVGKDKISAVADGDDCELWFDGELLYRKCEKITVHWNFVNEIHDGTVIFRTLNDGIYISAQDNKANIVFEEGKVNVEKSVQIKRELMDRNYNITDYNLF